MRNEHRSSEWKHLEGYRREISERQWCKNRKINKRDDARLTGCNAWCTEICCCMSTRTDDKSVWGMLRGSRRSLTHIQAFDWVLAEMLPWHPAEKKLQPPKMSSISPDTHKPERFPESTAALRQITENNPNKNDSSNDSLCKVTSFRMQNTRVFFYPPS